MPTIAVVTTTATFNREPASRHGPRAAACTALAASIEPNVDWARCDRNGGHDTAWFL
jgi:hypothetical protein